MRRFAAALAALASLAGAAPAWHSSTNCSFAAARHVCSARSTLAPLELFVAPSNDASVGAEWGESHTASGDLAYRTIVFSPNATADGAAVRGYAYDVYETSCYVDDPRASASAERLDIGDDRVVRVALAEWLPAGAPVTAFPFYGANYTALRVSANGHVTFEGAAESVARARTRTSRLRDARC